MQKTAIHIILLIVLVQLAHPALVGQSPVIPGVAERVILFTDRSLYVAGENICFSATILPGNPTMETGYSSVLYMEMISSANNPAITGKFRINHPVCTSCFKIPENLPTGIYYVKAYTRYMRNFGPESFSYNQVRIINPVESSKEVEDQRVNIQGSSEYFISGFKDYKLLEMITDKARYRQRDTVSVSIKPGITAGSIRSACISAIPACSGNNKIIATNKGHAVNGNLQYIPEYYGITLTGLVTDKVSGAPLPLRRVDLTLLGSSRDFISVLTGSDGRFFISMPDITGQRDIFIGTEDPDSVAPSILVDNDFCPYSIPIPGQAFTLSEDEQVTALNLLRNFRISSVFSPGNPQRMGDTVTDYNTPFYGEPVRTLDLNDYIPLPTLENYFNELSFLVKVRKTNGKKYLKIQGTSPETDIYPPLVLMDMVAVYDHNPLLSLLPGSISHIDIINEPYVKGNIIYGGIVSIFSKNNDFAGIDLPRSGLFIRYDFFSSPPSVNYSLTSGDIPDARNTLYWNGNLRIKVGTVNTINFVTGNSLGRYDIVLSGVLNDGTAFAESVSFVVE